MRQQSKLVTAPRELAVSLTEMKIHLRLDTGTAEDAELRAFIKSATERVEKFIDQKLITQTWDVFQDGFPGYKSGVYDDQSGVIDGSIKELLGQYGTIELPMGPIQSVTGLYTYDNEDTEFPFSASSYSIDTASHQGRIALRIGQVWPATVLRPVNGVKVRIVCGYGDDCSAVPDSIRAAIKLIVAKMYEFRGDNNAGEFSSSGFYTMPPTATMLLEPYRRMKLGC